MEAAHLAGLVTQFAELLEDAASAAGDPAIARLVPDAYSDDAEAAQEFRDLTEGDLLERRRQDAGAVLGSLSEAAALPDDAEPDDEVLMELVELRLDTEALQAWLRTLAAIRLVLATRLGIRSEDDHDVDDPRFGIYDWLGYRLDGLVQAARRRRLSARQGIAKTCVARLVGSSRARCRSSCSRPARPSAGGRSRRRAAARAACATAAATPATPGRRRAAPSPR